MAAGKQNSAAHDMRSPVLLSLPRQSQNLSFSNAQMQLKWVRAQYIYWMAVIFCNILSEYSNSSSSCLTVLCIALLGLSCLISCSSSVI